MDAPASTTFSAQSREAGSTALVEVARRFSGRIEPLGAARATLYDTLDARIHAAGGVLRTDGTTLSWTAPDGRVRHRLTVTRPPAFAWDLPPGDFRDELAEVIEVRRLVAVAEIVTEGRCLQVLDGAERPVARVALLWGVASVVGREDEVVLPARLRLEPVAGHEREHAAVRSLLERELALERSESGELGPLLAALGAGRERYGSKLRLDLTPELPAGDALRRVLDALLAALQANEDGVRRDLDAEFLHDYRVAARRARTLLGQFSGVLAPDPVARLREDLEWLGELTGPVRDLDVYLLEIGAAATDLPAEMRLALEPLGDLLRRRKEAARARLVEALDSERYAALVEAWRALVASRAEDAGPGRSAAPILELASGRIAKRFRRVLDRGFGITPDAPPADLHRLRIECKKLRYLLEFFRGLYEPGPLDAAVKSLRRLQDHLGEYNDRQVQQASLQRCAADLVEERAAAATLLALGRFLERLAERQAAARARFDKDFARFARCARPERLDWLRRGFDRPRPETPA